MSKKNMNMTKTYDLACYTWILLCADLLQMISTVNFLPLYNITACLFLSSVAHTLQLFLFKMLLPGLHANFCIILPWRSGLC